MIERSALQKRLYAHIAIILTACTACAAFALLGWGYAVAASGVAAGLTSHRIASILRDLRTLDDRSPT